jgi:hypothetical protein
LTLDSLASSCGDEHVRPDVAGARGTKPSGIQGVRFDRAVGAIVGGAIGAALRPVSTAARTSAFRHPNPSGGWTRMSNAGTAIEADQEAAKTDQWRDRDD